MKLRALTLASAAMVLTAWTLPAHAQRDPAPDVEVVVEPAMPAEAHAPDSPKPPDAAALLTAAEAKPDDPAGWLALGHGRRDAGDFEGALDAFARARGVSQAPLPVADAATAEIAGWLGRKTDVDGAVDRAIAAYAGAASGALTAADRIAVAEAMQVRARDDAQLYPRALDVLEAALRDAPDDPAIHVAIGDLLLDRFNAPEASDAYRDALEAQEGYAPARIGLARAQHFLRSTRAMGEVRALLKDEPANVEARTLLGRLLLRMEDYDGASRELETALAARPRSPEIRSLLVAVHFLVGGTEALQASQALQRAVQEETPGYSDMYVTLADIAAQNRRYTEAVRVARFATEREPRHWRGHAVLGTNALRIGNMSLARRSLETAFRGDPYDIWTRNSLELLDRLDGFARVRSERFVLVAEPGEAEVLKGRVLPLVEESFDFFAKRYVYRPPTPIQVEFHPSHEDFSVRTVGLTGIDIVGVSFGSVVALDSPSAGVFGDFNWASVLWHEIAHSFHIGLSDSRVPRWFSEGLAVHEERLARPGWGQDVDPTFLAAFAAGRLAPASDMNRAFLVPEYPQAIPHAYMQASLLMAMIEDAHGFDAIVSMLEGYRDGRSTEELLVSVLDTDAATFDADFDAYVRTRYAEFLENPERYAQLVGAAAADADVAEPMLAQAIAMLPGYAGRDSAFTALARHYAEAGNDASLADTLERIATIDADNLDANRRLAELYAEAGDEDGVARALERALLIQPFDPELHARLTDLHERASRLEDAVRAQQAVAALSPTDPIAERYRLASLMHRAGDVDAARREVLATLEAAPLYEDALELLLDIRDGRVSPADEVDAKPVGARPDAPTGDTAAMPSADARVPTPPGVDAPDTDGDDAPRPDDKASARQDDATPAEETRP